MMRQWGIAVGALLVLGCAGGQPQGKSGAEEGALRKRSLEELPPVGDYAPPVDEGRLLAAGPAGWSLLPRGRSYLVGFSRGKPSELPRIVISAQQPPQGSPEQLDAASASAFASQRAAELRAEVEAGRKQVEEYPLPLQLGPTVFIRHVRRASLGGTPCVVQTLETVQNGRLYSVELIAAIEAARSEEYEASLLKWRDYGYAVAAHLRFAPPGQQFDVLSTAPGPEAPAPDAPEGAPAAASPAATKANLSSAPDDTATSGRARPEPGTQSPKNAAP